MGQKRCKGHQGALRGFWGCRGAILGCKVCRGVSGILGGWEGL